jgi:hypothetical protein
MYSYCPAVPTEIWMHIFKLAASEPFSLIDTSPLPPATDEKRAWTDVPSPFNSSHPGYGKRVRMRHALILVNKHFHYLAIGILYKYIVMSCPESLLLFYRTLDDWRRSTKLGDAVNPAQSIKCLNLSMRMYDQTFQGRDERCLDYSFIASFRILTNLEILLIDGAMTPRDAWVQSLVLREILKNGCRMRYVNCSGDPGPFDKFPTAEIFQYQYATLEVLNMLLAVTGLYPFDFSALPPYTLPRLHTLKINSNHHSNILKWMSTWDLPSLQSCRLPVLAQSSETRTSDFLPFFKVHGKKIKTLCLDDIMTAACLLPILLHCPVIREFTIPPHNFIDLNPQIIRGLLVLRFSMPIFNHDGHSFDNVVSVLEQCMTLLFETYGKDLKRVRLLRFDASDLRPPMCTTQNLMPWKSWIERFEKEEIRFEFDDGELVKIPKDLLGLLRWKSS